MITTILSPENFSNVNPSETTPPPTPAGENIIEVQDLVKKYAGTTAVNEISFTARKGEIIGFLGPNGAGKSTTMRILTGFIHATSGQARIAGFPVTTHGPEIRRRLGYMPENNPLPEDLRVGEYLTLRGRIKGLRGRRLRERMGEVLENCDLQRAQRRIIGTLSKGFRQRVGIAEAIIAEPEVIIMDEPTIGLDPHQIAMIRDLILNLRGKMTILISSHILPEIEMTCDRVMIINAGRIVAADTPQNLRREFVPGTHYTALWQGDFEQLQARLQNYNSEIALTASPAPTSGDGFRELEIVTPGDHEIGEDLVRELTASPDFRLRSLHRKTPSLEEIFMIATKRSWEVVMPVGTSQSPS